MKKKKNLVPRAALRTLVEDINRQVSSCEGRLLVLETVEEIPFESRMQVLEGLSAFYTPQMVEFFHLLKKEYGKEMESLSSRALEKYRLAGMDIEPSPPFNGTFYKAYASCSRHTGRITLDVAWQTGSKGLHVECFYLTFTPDGIHSFFLLENMAVSQYENDRKSLPDMAEVTLAESCILIFQAYNFNIRNMTRPALGRFLYQRYLDYAETIQEQNGQDLIKRLSPELSPAQLVNCFFHALKYQDLDYIYSLSDTLSWGRTLLEKNFSESLQPGTTLLEGQIENVYGSRSSVWVQAFTTTVAESDFYRHLYNFFLQADQNNDWRLADIRHMSSEALSSITGDDHRLPNVFCRVYDILDLDRLFDILDRIDNIYEVEEMPCGMHMRVSCLEDNLNQGVSFLTGVVADLVINGEEFVILSHVQGTLKDFDMLLGHSPDRPVHLKGEYKIGLLAAYNFLRGRFLCFADAMEEAEAAEDLDDGLRFISTRYIMKDRESVMKRIGEIQNYQVKMQADYEFAYHLDIGCKNSFFAEYMIGSNWLTLSTFGELEMSRARQNLEDQMYDYLEMDGLEIREEGIFDILTADIKRDNPDLEGLLKEVYLNKWSQSRLSTLSGMTPSEASETEEGNRLIWTLLKNMKQKGKKRYNQGKKRYVHLNEYISKLQQNNEGQH
ncbi:MAG TPA: hypothetical protein VN426_14115 [Syntrophomonadaceae bacterium]|nr:hypothetical protein [Syntrophomonadaceae bacterium]